MNTTDSTTRAALSELSRRWLPRLLTAVCRDPASPHFGCFDRDWWHYRIRDFPSIILQQGALALHAASQLPNHESRREPLLALAAAACRFWNQRAKRHGAFEEYYPWEQGYPPLAFGTLAVMKLAAQGVVPPGAVREGARVGCRQLLSRFESEAANQQIAGLAALAWAGKVFPELVPPAGFAELAERSLQLQSDEGWFVEYGGPDLGYLSVTIDCLWDLLDVTGDPRYHASILRAVGCIAQFTRATQGRSLGMHNARNTDYLAPYGLVRAAFENPAAATVVQELFANADAPGHFLGATDDRYVCHYLGQSVLRATLLLETRPAPLLSPPASGTPLLQLTRSGHWLEVHGTHSLVVTARKGGILTMRVGAAEASDFGWIVQAGGRQFITHWWSEAWQFRREADALVVEGPMFEHKDSGVTPARHLLLRGMSLLFGRRLISRLKRRLIFEKRAASIRFRREVVIRAGALLITDRFDGLPAEATVNPAPRSSKRHVASADSFHPEDLHATQGMEVRREHSRQLNSLTVTTNIRFTGQPE